MDVLIITRGKLPLPNVKGGAVEYLIQKLIDNNEKVWKDNYTIYSNYNYDAKQEAKKYNYCEFRYIKLDGKINKIKMAYHYLMNKYWKYRGNYYILQVIKDLGDQINNFDVVIDENAPDYLEIIRKYYKGRIVFHSHNDWIDESNCKVLNNSDEYWTISNYLAKKIYINDIKTKVRVLYNGLDINQYTIYDNLEIKNLKYKYGISESFVFIFSGRLVCEKGVLELIKAFNKCGFENDTKLLVVGGFFYDSNVETPYIKECKKEAEGCDNIIFTGYVNSQEMKNLYHCANVGCFTSLWEEPFGMSLLEMIASGLPIIATNSGAVTEIISPQNAIIVEKEKNLIINLSKAMNRMRYDSEFRDKCIFPAQNDIKKFELQRYLEKYYHLLKEGN